MSGKRGTVPAAAAAAVAGKLAEDSAHERDDNSESTVSEDSLNRMGARQGSGSIEEIRRHRGDPQAAGQQQRYLEKGKGKMTERRRTDSASSLRSVGSASPSAVSQSSPQPLRSCLCQSHASVRRCVVDCKITQSWLGLQRTAGLSICTAKAEMVRGWRGEVQVQFLKSDHMHCRSVLRGRDGNAVGDGAGPSSSSEGGSGSMPGSAPESLSGSEGMAPIKTVSILSLMAARSHSTGLCHTILQLLGVLPRPKAADTCMRKQSAQSLSFAPEVEWLYFWLSWMHSSAGGAHLRQQDRPQDHMGSSSAG